MSVTPRAYGPPMPSRTKTAKTVHRCSECGCETPRWLGRCPECDAWGTLGEVGTDVRHRHRGAGPRSTARCRSATSTPAPPRRCPPGVGELDRVLGGGLVAGSVTLLARRAGHGQEHAAAPGARAPRRAAARAACSSPPRSRARRCELRAERVGALAARPARGGRDVAARTSSPTPPTPAPAGARGRLDPDRRRSRSARRARVGHAGARRARTGSCSTPRSTGCATVLVGHVTKEGTLAGPARARARRRHRALVRRRPRPLAAAAARAEAPVRRHRRARAVRDDRARPRRRARRVGALPRRPPPGRRRARRSPRCSRARGRSSSRCRRWSMRDRGADAAAVAPPGIEPGGSRCCSRCSSVTPGSTSTGADVYASVAGGLRVTEPGLDLAARARGGRRAALASSTRRHGRGRRARPRRRGAQRCRSSTAGWPRPRASGSGARWCPRACAGAPDRRPGARRGEQPASHAVGEASIPAG